MNYLKYILSIVFILNLSFVYAQNCSVKLKDAEKLYNEGTIEQIPKLLLSCIEKGFVKDEKLRAYKLLILTYLYEDNQAEADDCMLQLLKLEPEYQINSSIDPADFVHLFNSFQTESVYSFGIIAGLNLSKAKIGESYGIQNVNDVIGEYNANGLRTHFGLKFNYHLIENTELNAELLFTQNNFEKIDTILGFSELRFDESQTRLDLPISVTYNVMRFNKITPYVRLGANIGFLLKAHSTTGRTYIDNSLGEVSGPDILIKDYRRRLNYWFIAGAGAKYKIKNGYVFVDARYNIGLLNQVDESKRYANSELIYKYYHQDDNFILDNMMISVGYMHMFYNPKKNNAKD